MPSQNENASQNTSSNPGDVLSQLMPNSQREKSQHDKEFREQMKLLESIDQSLQHLTRSGGSMSQANAINSGYNKSSYSYRQTRTSSSMFDDDIDPTKIGQGIASTIARSMLGSRGIDGIIRSVVGNLTNPIKQSITSSVFDLLDGIEHSIKEGAGQSKFKKKLKDTLGILAKDLGVDTKDIKKALGRELGKKLLGNSDMKAITDFFSDLKSNALKDAKDIYSRSVDKTEIGALRSELEEELRRQHGSDELNSLKTPEERLKEKQERDKVKKDETPEKSLAERVKEQQENLAKLQSRRNEDQKTADDVDANKSEASESKKAKSTNPRNAASEAQNTSNALINDISVFVEKISLNAAHIDTILSEYLGKDYNPYKAYDNFSEAQLSDMQGTIDGQAPEILDINVPEVKESTPTPKPTNISQAKSSTNITMPDLQYAKNEAGKMDTIESLDRSETEHILSNMLYDKSAYAKKHDLYPDMEMDSIVDSESDKVHDNDIVVDIGELIAERLNFELSRLDTLRSRGEIDEVSYSAQVLEAQVRALEAAENNAALKDELSAASANGMMDVAKQFAGKAETILESNKQTAKVVDAAKFAKNSTGRGILSEAKEAYNLGKQRYTKELGMGLDSKEMSGMNGLISSLTGGAEGASAAGAAMSGLANVVETLGPEAMIAAVGFKLVSSTLKKAFQPAIEGAKKSVAAVDAAFNRFHTSNLKNIENSQKRLIADINTLVQTPFDLLRKGAEEWYNAWDNNLRTITATQGYTKSDLQNLMASFADRLRNEGLTNVVSATDITNSLTKVLESGLSGDIAEEFAYIATKLNAAVPTQDFFSYADTYASIAANAVRTGMEQSEAIEYANQQLTAFANNVLYASREVAGGFTTGLKNAESLFKQSVQIAQAGRTYNASEISGVMTAVSAITGAIAPDLASAMTDAIYKAAVGGNSTDILALRSLAGGNVSATEFLRDLTSNPKQVFTELFTELARRQNMSENAYMEVAEGLSSIFGLSAESFARVDFGYLAQAIAAMDTSSKALTENMMLLASGETTTNAEQLKMQQINEQILNEGLSYVLDNEAARAIQQHMWDEQLARELQETEYSVSLRGAALELLEGIRSAVDTIATILNPVKLLGKIVGLFTSSKEDNALRADIGQILDLGKVGTGNQLSRYNLVTYNKDLNLVSDLNTMMGGSSSFKSLNSVTTNMMKQDLGAIEPSGFSGSSTVSGSSTAPTSKYRWDSIGKSIAYDILNSSKQNAELQGIEGIKKYESGTTTVEEQAATSENLQKMLDYMQTYVNNNPDNSYEDFVNTARSYGISDYDKVIKEFGLTNDQVAAQYAVYQAQITAKQEKERNQREEEYWDKTENALTDSTTSVQAIKDLADQISGAITNVASQASTIASTIQSGGEMINTKIDTLVNSTDAVKQAIENINMPTMDSTTEILRSMNDQLKLMDDRIWARAWDEGKDADGNYNDMGVAGWLRKICYQLAGTEANQTQGVLNLIAAGISGIESTSNNPYDSNGGTSDTAVVTKLEQIANILLSMGGPTQFASPMQMTLRGAATNS